jgi:restriction endonuclease
LDQGKRRDSANQKIKFGKLHFEALSKKPEDAVDFKDCVTLQGALASLTHSQEFKG